MRDRTSFATTHPEMNDLLKRAIETVEAMTPEERAEMIRKQKESWVRGELGMGETSVTINPQPRQPLKTAPSLDYTAGFRAGIEAAAVHVLRGVLPGTESLQAPDAGRIATAIRNLKPEPGHD